MLIARAKASQDTAFKGNFQNKLEFLQEINSNFLPRTAYHKSVTTP